MGLCRYERNWAVVEAVEKVSFSRGFDQGDMLLSVGASSSLLPQHGMTQGAPWVYPKSSAPVPPFLRQNSSVSSGASRASRHDSQSVVCF